MGGLNEMIAGIQIAIMLQNQRKTAYFLRNAHACWKMGPAGQCRIECLDKHRANIMMHPVLENLDQKRTILPGFHRTVAYQMILPERECVLFPRQAPLTLNRLQAGPWHPPLHDGDELDEPRLQGVPEKVVHLQWMGGIHGMHRAENISVHIMLLQQVPPAPHLVEASLSAFIDPVGVVHFSRSIQAQADEEVVLFEERAPVVVKQRAVGLQGVGHPLARPFVFINQFNRALEEIQAHQAWFSSLPGHTDLSGLLGCQQLFYIRLKHLIRHAQAAIRIKLILPQVKTICASQVACGTRRLSQQREGSRCAAG